MAMLKAAPSYQLSALSFVLARTQHRTQRVEFHPDGRQFKKQAPGKMLQFRPGAISGSALLPRLAGPS